jgi:hypothetical protein
LLATKCNEIFTQLLQEKEFAPIRCIRCTQTLFSTKLDRLVQRNPAQAAAVKHWRKPTVLSVHAPRTPQGVWGGGDTPYLKART